MYDFFTCLYKVVCSALARNEESIQVGMGTLRRREVEIQFFLQKKWVSPFFLFGFGFWLFSFVFTLAYEAYA